MQSNETKMQGKLHTQLKSGPHTKCFLVKFKILAITFLKFHLYVLQRLIRGCPGVNTWMHKLKQILVQEPSLGPKDYSKFKN